MKRLKGMSLFANVGIAEAYLEEIGIDIVLANEIDPKRTAFYKHVYPKTKVIEGDISCNEIKDRLITEGKKLGIDLIMATPPCQGMSTAGKMDKWDSRNSLVCDAVDIIKKIKPKYVFLENVPQQLKTKILFDNREMHIPDYIKLELQQEYRFNETMTVNAADYGVPQMRERAIMLLVRKDLECEWEFPESTGRTSLREALKNVPSLDPEIYDISYNELIDIFPEFEKKKKAGLSVSKWHYPPKHVLRQVITMMHTPTGKSAFENIDLFKPKKKNGDLVKGFKNTYKRQEWDKPGTTVTMYNREISSQGNVHPGFYWGKDKDGYEIYSDPRVMSIYELMIMMSIPKEWNIPDNVTDHFLRCVIGEGIPPLLVKKIMEEIKEIKCE